MRGLAALALVLVCLVPLAPAGAQEQHGALSFPADEMLHGDGLDYWWGAADVVAESGNRYTVSMAYTSFWGHVVTGHQLWAHQGPYLGRTILTPSGPAEWGHPSSLPGEYLTTALPHLPVLNELLRLETRHVLGGGAVVDRFARTSLDGWEYELLVDTDAAKVHPDGDVVRWRAELAMTMHDGPPLLAGGTGSWWYGIPQTIGYPSRSFQYMQASRQVTGIVELQQPDGSILVEAVDPSRSSWVMIHEYDATPEDIPAGLGLAQVTQVSPTYVQSYEGGMPWEIIFVDLENEAQLMLVVLAFHFTEEGTLADLVAPTQPTYRILATLRLPSGESIALDDELLVEHLSYRELVGRVPTAFVQIWGHWIQGWELRVGHPGGTLTAGDGSSVEVPPFDLGLTPAIDARHPLLDADGAALVQRTPYRAAGQWDGCPMRGAGWSEQIINWRDRTAVNPWYTGGELPDVPASCGPAEVGTTAGNGLPLVPDPGDPPPPVGAPEGCAVNAPAIPTCTYVASIDAGLGGIVAAPGGWTATITRPGLDDPIVVTGYSGFSMYNCGTIQAGDTVVLEASAPGSGAFAGNPAICGDDAPEEPSPARILPGPTAPGPAGEPVVQVTTPGADATEQSLAWSRLRFADGQVAEALYASDEVFADALASGVLQDRRPLLLGSPDVLEEAVAAELARLGVTRVRILGGPAAVGEAVVAALRAEGYDVVRTAGQTRVGTAVAIADLAGGPGRLVARAWGPDGAPDRAVADSLAAGAWAAESRWSLLLTDGARLSDEAAASLDRDGVPAVALVGGGEAVGDDVQAALQDMGAQVRRVAGADRAATAVAIATGRGFGPDSPAGAVILLDGTSPTAWQPGLTAAGPSAGLRAPILLADGDDLPAATADFLASSVQMVDGQTVVHCAAEPAACAAAARIVEEGQDAGG